MIEYAGFWRRVGAALTDGLWLGTLLAAFFYLLYGHANTAMWQTFLSRDVLPALIVIFFWIKYRATPGKLLFDCNVVDMHTGQSISFKQAVLRYLGYTISFLPLGLGFFWIIWDARKQGWPDKIAGTVVVIHDEAHTPLQELEKIHH